MNHELNDFDSSVRSGAEPGGREFEARTCGVCGQEYPHVRDECPHCGHGTGSSSSRDHSSQQAASKSPYDPAIDASNPTSRGIGFLVDAPTDGLAQRFAAVAIGRLKTVNHVSDDKRGITTPSVTLIQEADTPIVKPWGDLSSVPEAIPLGGEDQDHLDALVESMDWDTREPTPVLYTEYGEPLVETDALQEYMDKHEPSWLIPAIATETTHTGRNRVLERDQRCGYCESRTAHVYAGREGSPSEVTVDHDLSAPIWECSECGNYQLGGSIKDDSGPEERSRFKQSPPSQRTAH